MSDRIEKRVELRRQSPGFGAPLPITMSSARGSAPGWTDHS